MSSCASPVSLTSHYPTSSMRHLSSFARTNSKNLQNGSGGEAQKFLGSCCEKILFSSTLGQPMDLPWSTRSTQCKKLDPPFNCDSNIWFQSSFSTHRKLYLQKALIAPRNSFRKEKLFPFKKKVSFSFSISYWLIQNKEGKYSIFGQSEIRESKCTVFFHHWREKRDKNWGLNHTHTVIQI